MPHRTIPINNVQETVSRPVALTILQDIVERLRIGNRLRSGYNLVFNVNGEVVAPPWGAEDDNSLHQVRVASDLRIEITLEENVAPHSVFVRPVEERTHFIFADPDNQVYAKVLYSTIDARMSIKIIGGKQQEVKNTARLLSLSKNLLAMQVMHTAQYSYMVPDLAHLLMVNVWMLRENIDGYGDQIKDYIQNRCNPGLSLKTDQAGKHKWYAINETGININGTFDFAEESPKPEREDNIGVYSLSFEYNYHYDRPDYVHLDYPVSIHSQLLDPMFLDIQTKPSNGEIIGKSTHSNDIIGSWRYNPADFLWPKSVLYRQPYFDTWKPVLLDTNIHPFATLLAAKEDDPLLVLNLKDTEPDVNFAFSKALLKYMKATHTRMGDLRSSLVQYRLFRWDDLIETSQTSINSDLSVYTNEEFSARDHVHVVVGFVKNLLLLNPIYRRELLDHPEFFKAYLAIFHPRAYAKFIEGGDLDEVIDAVKPENPSLTIPMVGQLIIIPGERS